MWPLMVTIFQIHSGIRFKKMMQYRKEDAIIIKKKDTGMESRSFSQDKYLSGFYKADRLLPVMTLTVFYSAEERDGPLTLR